MLRRDFLKWLAAATAGVAAAGAGLFSFFRTKKSVGSHTTTDAHSSSSFPAVGSDGVGNGRGILERVGHSYGNMIQPPAGLDSNQLVAFERPLSATNQKSRTVANPVDGMPGYSRQKIRSITIDCINRSLNVAHNTIFHAWTFNNMMPGPVIRATENELLDITFNNKTPHSHSLHFHGSHSVNQDGWTPIPPGKNTKYKIKAGPVGVHPYHCHVPPLDEHMARGLYGALIVDPPGGRAAAHEVVLILHGFDLGNQGRNDLYAWNGIAGYYDRFPIKVKKGELVRLYIINMLEYEPVASFHLHAQTFDVYRSGTGKVPSDHTDVVTLGQSERVMLEFRLPERGRYMFHPHQIHMAGNGAMGWIVAI